MSKKKRRVKVQSLVFSLLLLIALTYSLPAEAKGSDVTVRTLYSQVDGQAKKGYKEDYQAKKKAAKAEYRQTVRKLKNNLAITLGTASSKGERREAHKKFKEGLKTAQEKLNAALKAAKEEYKKKISQ